MKTPARLVRFVRISAIAITASVALAACCTIHLPVGNAKFALVLSDKVEVGVGRDEFICALCRHALPLQLTSIFFNGVKILAPFDCPGGCEKKAAARKISKNARDEPGSMHPAAIHVGQVAYFRTVTDLEAFLEEVAVQPPAK